MVCPLVTFKSPAKTVEQIEMPFGDDSDGPKEPIITRGSRSRGRGNFVESIVNHCCSVCSNKINNGISAIAAFGCIDLD